MGIVEENARLRAENEWLRDRIRGLRTWLHVIVTRTTDGLGRELAHGALKADEGLATIANDVNRDDRA